MYSKKSWCFCCGSGWCYTHSRGTRFCLGATQQGVGQARGLQAQVDLLRWGTIFYPILDSIILNNENIASVSHLYNNIKNNYVCFSLLWHMDTKIIFLIWWVLWCLNMYTTFYMTLFANNLLFIVWTGWLLLNAIIYKCKLQGKN